MFIYQVERIPRFAPVMRTVVEVELFIVAELKKRMLNGKAMLVLSNNANCLTLSLHKYEGI